ncbi:50S ribosomal protein L6 [bacterium]|nr:50S ribosomal protein L6 [bacterium]
MSRVGKKSITIPNGVHVDIKERKISIKGPKGELHYKIPSEIEVEYNNDELSILTDSEPKEKKAHALHGLNRTLIANMIEGVTVGFRKELKIVGIGYRANITGRILNLLLGYSHPIKYDIPDKIDIDVNKDSIIVQGVDKQKVGQVAAEIRDFRRPEPYKGKGVRYADEKVRSKVGKAGA